MGAIDARLMRRRRLFAGRRDRSGGLVEPGQVAAHRSGRCPSWLRVAGMASKLGGCSSRASNSAQCTAICQVTRRATWTCPTAVGRLLTHPWRALQMFGTHAGYVGGYVASAGIIGLRSLVGRCSPPLWSSSRACQREAPTSSISRNPSRVGLLSCSSWSGLCSCWNSSAGMGTLPRNASAHFRRVHAGTRCVRDGCCLSVTSRVC